MRRRKQARTRQSAAVQMSFGTWDSFPADNQVVIVCHPEWRGIKTAAYTFRTPVIEVADAAAGAEEILDGMERAGVRVMVVHGFPPGSDVLLRRASAAGVATRVVLHSSQAQHGAEAGEARVIDTVLALAAEGAVGCVGFVKQGMAEAFAALGHRVAYVPNRAPDVALRPPPDAPKDRVDVGIFAEPFWRKNVVTQLAALPLIPGARGHVLTLPAVEYLRTLDVVEHGVLPWTRFIELQSSMDLNLYVTLSECHPLTPIESYLSGVPCLISRTSAVFADDPDLIALTAVAEADNPSAIAAGAERLLEHRREAVAAARAWIERWDTLAADRWEDFVV